MSLFHPRHLQRLDPLYRTIYSVLVLRQNCLFGFEEILTVEKKEVMYTVSPDSPPSFFRYTFLVSYVPESLRMEM